MSTITHKRATEVAIIKFETSRLGCPSGKLPHSLLETPLIPNLVLLASHTLCILYIDHRAQEFFSQLSDERGSPLRNPAGRSTGGSLHRSVAPAAGRR